MVFFYVFRAKNKEFFRRESKKLSIYEESETNQLIKDLLCALHRTAKNLRL